MGEPGRQLEACGRPSRFKKRPGRLHPFTPALCVGRSQSPQRTNHAIIRVIKNLLNGNAKTSCLPNFSVTQRLPTLLGKNWRPRKGQVFPYVCTSRPRKSQAFLYMCLQAKEEPGLPICAPPGEPVFPAPRHSSLLPLLLLIRVAFS